VPRLRRAAVEFVETRCPEADELSVALAVTEACSNVVHHAYPNGQGDMLLEMRLESRDVVATVTDTGIGITGQPTSRAGAQLGLPLLRHVADTTIRNDGGTIVEMRFRAASGPERLRTDRPEPS
jgi:two-component sensor histidine kinase